MIRFPMNTALRVKVFVLSSIAGLRKWVDYIPVLPTTPATKDLNTTNDGGALDCFQLSSESGSVRGRDHIPVYIVGSGKRWSFDDSGYIPVANVSGGGGSTLHTVDTTSFTADLSTYTADVT